MTKKGLDVLKALLNHDFHCLISEITIGKDKNVDDDYSQNIVFLCQQYDIKYFFHTDKVTITSNYSIAISWRWLIPKNKSTLIVLHDSLLPKYRGFAPLVNMLINKEPQIGVSAIFASDEYDKGDLIAQSATKINYPIKISTAIDLLSKNYAELVISIFQILLNNGTIQAIPQNNALASYSLWRNDDDYLIDFNKDANDVLNFINAVSFPYKGASSYINGVTKIRVIEATIENDVDIENRDIGKVIFVRDKCPIIVCSSGLLKLVNVIDDKTKESLIPFRKFRVRLADSKKK